DALDRHEHIVLFGDYDVDGVTSLVLLAEILRAYGAAPDLFLPLRMEEGYGLSRESMERCLEQHRPRLLIAVDCGTSSVTEIAEINQRGAIEIARSIRPGLRKLIEIGGVRPPILAEDIGFRIGPRLNAAGRLSTAERSMQLLLAKDESEAAALADFLDKQNRERQEIE